MSHFFRFESGNNFFGPQGQLRQFTTPQVPDALGSAQRETGRKRRGKKNQDGIAGIINQGDVGSLANLQIQSNQAARDASAANREAAVAELRGYLSQGNPQRDEVFNQLSTDFTDTPFNRMLRDTIRNTIENPDVISNQSINNFRSRAQGAAGAAIDSARRNLEISSAQRGVGGSGVDQRLLAQLGLEGSAAAEAQAQEFDNLAQQLRAENLAQAQGLGAEFSTGLANANNQRLGTLASFQANTDAQNIQVVSAIADILASTVFEPDDFSGFASLASQVNDRAFALQQHQDNINLLNRQLELQELQGLQDFNLQSQAFNAQQSYNAQLSDLNSMLDGILAEIQ
jgi:hypothetical protein